MQSHGWELENQKKSQGLSVSSNPRTELPLYLLDLSPVSFPHTSGSQPILFLSLAPYTPSAYHFRGSQGYFQILTPFLYFPLSQNAHWPQWKLLLEKGQWSLPQKALHVPLKCGELLGRTWQLFSSNATQLFRTVCEWESCYPTETAGGRGKQICGGWMLSSMVEFGQDIGVNTSTCHLQPQFLQLYIGMELPRSRKLQWVQYSSLSVKKYWKHQKFQTVLSLTRKN